MIEDTSKKQQFQRVLEKYLPAFCVEDVTQMLLEFPLDFKIVRPRKRKLGDYRFQGPNGRPMITINGNLNPFQFLITTIHELAHAKAFRDFGPRIAPHGKEWKSVYRALSTPFINHPELPSEIAQAWMDSLIRVKASSCADAALTKVLFAYNEDNGSVLLENIESLGHFLLENQVFSKGPIRRKRYLCTRLADGKQYLVSSTAEVKPV